MACPLCGEHCTCSFAGGTRVSAPHSLTNENEEGPAVMPVVEEAHSLSPAKSAQPDVSSRTDASDSAFEEARPIAPPEDITLESHRPPTPDEVWKQEVADRLQSYRARRGTRRPRFNGTLSLDFDRATNRMLNSALAAEEAAAADAANEFFGATANEINEVSDATEAESYPGSPQPAPDSRVPKSESPASKIIEFPRLPTLFDPLPNASELADPVLDKPRILYVPEEVPTSDAPLADIHLNPAEPTADPELELPLHVAPMGQRFFAGLTDIVIVLIAAFIFLAIVLRDVPAPDSRGGYALVAVLPAIFWSIYQYMFLVYSATTPGMRLARLSLASFDSDLTIRRDTRRTRAVACILSACPLGMGLIWALLDDDTLCWHDRISRTYLVHNGSDY